MFKFSFLIYFVAILLQKRICPSWTYNEDNLSNYQREHRLKEDQPAEQMDVTDSIQTTNSHSSFVKQDIVSNMVSFQCNLELFDLLLDHVTVLFMYNGLMISDELQRIESTMSLFC